jgi:hypothetical protein
MRRPERGPSFHIRNFALFASPAFSCRVQLKGLHIPPAAPLHNLNGPRLPQDPESPHWLPISFPGCILPLPSLAFTHLLPRWRLPPTGRHIPAPLGRQMCTPTFHGHTRYLKSLASGVRHGGERMASMQQHARSPIGETFVLLSFRTSLSDSNGVTFLCPRHLLFGRK